MITHLTAVEQAELFIETMNKIGEFNSRTVQVRPVELGPVVNLYQFDLTYQVNLPPIRHESPITNMLTTLFFLGKSHYSPNNNIYIQRISRDDGDTLFGYRNFWGTLN